MKSPNWIVSLILFILLGCVPAFIEYRIHDERFRMSEANPRSFVADFDGISIQLKVYSRAGAGRLICCEMKINNKAYNNITYDISQMTINGNEGVYHVSDAMVEGKHHSVRYVTSVNRDENKEIICAAWNDYADDLSTEVDIYLGKIIIPPLNTSIDLGSIRFSIER